MTEVIRYTIPAETGRLRAFVLAVLVHVFIVGLLFLSAIWQRPSNPTVIEAEVWDPMVTQAAPLPTPEEMPEPEPEVAPPPKVEEIIPPVIDPEIALKADKKRKVAEEKKAREQREKDEKKALLEKKKEKDKVDLKKRKQELLEQAQRDKARAQDMQRIMAQAGSGGSGESAKTQGARGDASYLGRIAGKIKSNTIFSVPENMVGNPTVEYTVELLPDGSIRRPIKKNKPSGVPGFDEAVLNAIEKSQPYPTDKNGSVPSSISVSQHPKDQ